MLDDLAGVDAAASIAARDAPCAARGAARSSSSALEVARRRRGSSRPCHSVSSTSRLPTPARTDWSSRRALTGAVPRPTRSRNSRRRSRRRRDRAREVGVEPHPAQPPLVEQPHSAAVVEGQREPEPRGLGSADLGRRAAHRVAALAPGLGPSVTTIRPPMPRWIPRTGLAVRERARGVAPHRLAAPVGRGQPAPDQASRISPGACGRHTQLSVSSTSAIRRSSAAASITGRANSTSGSSGTSSVCPQRPTGPALAQWRRARDDSEIQDRAHPRACRLCGDDLPAARGLRRQRRNGRRGSRGRSRPQPHGGGRCRRGRQRGPTSSRPAAPWTQRRRATPCS